jgi:pyrroloquinoline quinone (PQQ) biosynthesis protein C
LLAEARGHRAVHHPYLAALREGAVPDAHRAMADFARQYHGYTAHFPRFLTALISRLDNPRHRAALTQSLTDESGHYSRAELDQLATAGIRPEWIVGVSHAELFLRFKEAMGVPGAPEQEDELEVACWREMLLGVLVHGSPAEAVGALGLGTESIVRSIYEPLTHGVNRLDGLSPRETVFFALHATVDDHHVALLRAIAASFAETETGRRDLAKGMRKALVLRASFWDWMYDRAMRWEPLELRFG